MTSSSRLLRMLDIVSALVLVVAIALFVWPVSVAVPASNSPVEPAPKSVLPAVRTSDNDAASIVAANILSSSRHAPSVRYTSPDLLPATDYSVPAVFAPTVGSDSAKGASEATDAVPSVYGIVNTDGTWRALLRLTESDVSPALLREGDRRGPYQVVSIRPNAVVVAGPSGQRTLRLNRSSRADSTGKPQ